MQARTKTPNKTAILKFLADYGGDGWSILNPDGLVKTYGFPPAWVKPLIYNHVAGEGKYAIYDQKTGQSVKTLKGVHTLQVLCKLAVELRAEYGSFNGRGFQARSYTEGIRKVLEPNLSA